MVRDGDLDWGDDGDGDGDGLAFSRYLLMNLRV